jgi:uncharacterized membrane protein YhaH (DUF805 family)
VHAAIAALPILLSPLLVLALGNGWIDFGGGEKDLFLFIPYFIASLAFFICALVLIVRRWPLGRWAIRSFAISAALLAALGVVAYMTSWLGVS